MPYPLRFRLHASYRVPGKNRQDELYHKHSFSLTYIQGFYDLGNASRAPYIAGAYVFSLLDHFEVGTDIGFSGFNRFELGAFMAFRAGAFRFGIGSGNITAAVFPNIGSGADVSLTMALSF